MQRVIDTNPETLSRLTALVGNVSDDCFRPNGFGRMFAPHIAIDRQLVQDVFSAFGLTWEHPEPMFGHFVGKNYLVGAAVHAHSDPAPQGFHHVRCNVMVTAPTSGGNPVLDDKEAQVKQGQSWICFASLEKHASTPVEGGERIVVSLGGLIPVDVAKSAYAAITTGVNKSTPIDDNTRAVKGN